MFNIALSQGVPELIADALVAPGVSPIVFVVPPMTNRFTGVMTLYAEITNPVAASGHLLYRPDDLVDFVDAGPDDSIDFVTFPVQQTVLSPGQYKLELDTMTSDEISVKVVVG